MKTSLKIRALAFFLITLMVFYVLPVNCMQNLVAALTSEDATQNDTTNDGLGEELYVLGEDLSKREESAKHFRMSDGSYVAVQYGEPVHYLDENGEYIEYDNTLTIAPSTSGGLIGNLQSGSLTTENITAINGFKANKSDVSVTLANNASQNALTSISKGEYSVSIIPLSLNTSSKVVVNNTKSKPTLSSKPTVEEASKLYNHSSSVKYEGLFSGADLEYVLSGSNLKENIIVNEKADSYVYRFNLNLTGLYAVLNEDGSISLIGNNTDKIEFTIPAGYMFDAAGNYSEGVTYTLTSKKAGSYILTVTADSEWINADNRVFPVTVDPTLEVFTKTATKIKDTYIIEGSPSTNTGDYAWMYVGYSTSNLISLVGIRQDNASNLPTIPDSSVITSASLTLRTRTNTNRRSGTGDMYIGAYLAECENGTWNAGTATWNNTVGNETLSISEEVLDYQIIDLNDFTAQTYDFDITKAVKSWYEKNDGDYGIAFKAITPKSNTYIGFETVNYSTSNFYPYFLISYRDNKGLEDTWTYHSQSSGIAGVGYINDFSGNLVFAHDDMTTLGTVLPVTVGHVFNSYLAGKQFTNCEKAITISNFPMSVGYGWKLTSWETIVPIDLDGNGSTDHYVHSDSDGTEHYYLYDSSSLTGYNEDDPYLTLTVNSTQRIISDEYGNSKTFNKNGFLTKITDSNNNSQVFSYDSSNRLSTLKLLPAGEQTYTSELSFVFNTSGGLTKIINALKTNEYLEFKYSAEYNSSDLTASTGYLRKIIYTSNSGVTTQSRSYTYTEEGFLEKAIDDVSGRYIEYSYTGSKVTTVSEYSRTGTLGQTLVISYLGNKTTEFRTSGKDDIFGNDDDIFTTYVFDDSGRTISAYSSDKNNVIYGASNTQYNPTFTKSNNSISSEAIGSGAPVNYVLNPSFENSTSSWTFISNSGNTFTTSNSPFLGEKSLTYSGSNTVSQVDYASQTISITKGYTYSFSSYVCTNLSGNNSKVYLEVLENGASISKSIEMTWNTNQENVQNGFERISCEFIVEGSGATSCEIRLVLSSVAGTVHFDCIQLEQSKAPSNYNMIENSGFESNSAWTSSSSTYVSNSSSEHIQGYGALKVEGYPSDERYVYQNIPVNSKGTQTFILSGWAKAQSVDISKDDSRKFGLKAVLTFSNNETQTVSAEFNFESEDWQYVSMGIVPKLDETDMNSLTITQIKVYCEYNYNANTAYFDGISLTKEPAQTYKYDSNGNLTAINTADGQTNIYSYENGTDLTSQTAPNNDQFTYTYNVNELTQKNTHQVKTITSSGGTKVEYTYNAQGDVTGSKISNSSNSLYITGSTSYSAFGSNAPRYMTGTTDALGNTVTYNYQTATGLLNYVDSANGNRTQYIYDSFYNTTGVYLDSDKDGVIDTNESGVSYSYENGELKTIQTPSGTYSFAYDEFLNTTSITIGNTTLAEYTYNNFNGKLKTISQNGKVEEYVYDELDRIVEIVYNGVTKYTFVYNGNGTLYSATDKSSSKTYYYEYDALGRLIRYSERNADGTRVVYIQNGYDDIGRASDSKYVFEDGTVHEYDLNYKTNSNLVQSIKIPTDKSIVYQYDALERETTRTLGNMFETYYTYKNGVAENQTSTSIASIHLNTGTSSLSFKYDYDNEGNITHIYEGNILKQSYEYDELNRLTRENDAYAGKTYVYEYDKNGNRTAKKTYEYTTATSLGNVLQTEIYTYGNSNWKDLLTNYQVLDSENTVIKNKNFNFNSAGNPFGTVSMSPLGYDDADMLWEYGCGDEYVHCYYNSDGIRIKKIIYHVDWEYIITIEYILDGSTIIGEKRTRTGENPMTETLYYIYDDKGELAGFTYNGTPYYYGKNIQGDIVSIYDANADLVVRYTYDAWGNDTGITGTLASTIGEINPFRYRGYYFDSESGCYYLISRYYDPVTGRFVTPDAVDVLGIEQANLGQYNLFAYCLNDPVNRVDEDGNWSWKKVLKVVAAVAVVTVAVAAVAAVTAGTGGAAGAALCAASGALKGAAIGAVKGAVSGAISGGATSAIKHRITTGSWKGAGKAALNGAIDGAKSGAASGAVLGAFAGGITSNCFVAGTEILTVAGLVAIENISEGDEVLAENPETGEKGVKRVVQTFVKQSYNLVHIYVEDEEIVTTPEHPFWEMNREWCSAIEIRAGDILKLSNGKTAVVSKVYSETLSSPVTVYNFEVEDYHTYYVGNHTVLVHNLCKQELIAGNKNGYNAKVSVGGEQNHARPHAHIFYKRQKLASVDESGEVIVGKLDKNGRKFVKESLTEISSGIKKWWYYGKK